VKRTSAIVEVRVQGPSGLRQVGAGAALSRGLLKSREAVVLSGRCYERETVPYKVFDSVIDSLSRYLHTMFRSEAAALLPPTSAC